jgi:hypothetical protein
LEEELARKIGGVEETLRTLRNALGQIHVNSSKAKAEVTSAYEAMQARLTNRKVELIRQIDLISQSQINSLQEGIQTTLIAMGSLQATMANLESFDNAQLLNLHIPDLSACCNVPVVAPIDVKFKGEELSKEVSRWGEVSAKGVKGLVEVGSSASMPKRFVEYNDERGTRNEMSHKPVKEELASVADFRLPPKLPSASEGISVTSSINAQDFNLDDWLVEINSAEQFEGDGSEEFEVVTLLGGVPGSDREMKNLQSEMEKKCTIEPEKTREVMDDLTKWLSRNRRNIQSSSTESVPAQSPCPPGRSSPSRGDETSIKVKTPVGRKHFIEFPCLGKDDNYWIPSKKAKTIHAKPIFCGKEFLPPAYALPTPFWLKKSF